MNWLHWALKPGPQNMAIKEREQEIFEREFLRQRLIRVTNLFGRHDDEKDFIGKEK